MTIKSLIRTVPHYPKQGVMFRDITTLLKDPVGFRITINEFVHRYTGAKIDKIAGIESRGFIIGAAVAYALRAGLTVVRKPGKLPSQTFAAQYELEYGNDALEIHRDAFGHPCRVLIVDDLLATGGTARAAVELVERLGGEVVECAFLVELSVLKGRERVRPHAVFSVMQYDD
jgi:adenine phosphoribosyltransferase